MGGGGGGSCSNVGRQREALTPDTCTHVHACKVSYGKYNQSMRARKDEDKENCMSKLMLLHSLYTSRVFSSQGTQTYTLEKAQSTFIYNSPLETVESMTKITDELTMLARIFRKWLHV